MRCRRAGGPSRGSSACSGKWWIADGGVYVGALPAGYETSTCTLRMPALSAKNWNVFAPTMSGDGPPMTMSPSFTRAVCGTPHAISSGFTGTLLLRGIGKGNCAAPFTRTVSVPRIDRPE